MIDDCYVLYLCINGVCDNSFPNLGLKCPLGLNFFGSNLRGKSKTCTLLCILERSMAMPLFPYFNEEYACLVVMQSNYLNHSLEKKKYPQEQGVATCSESKQPHVGFSISILGAYTFRMYGVRIMLLHLSHVL